MQCQINDDVTPLQRTTPPSQFGVLDPPADSSSTRWISPASWSGYWGSTQRLTQLSSQVRDLLSLIHVLLSFSNIVSSTCVHLFILWLFWKCTVYAKIFKFFNLSELKNFPVLLIFPLTSLTNKTNLVILKCTSKTYVIWGKQVISLLCT